MSNWIYENKEVLSINDMPEKCVGFVYMLFNKSKNHYYIGKKILQYKRTLKPLKNTKKKRHVIKPSGWETYTGSNELLNEDIKKGDVIEKKILKYCFSKKQLSYHEVKFQFQMNALEDENCYNSNILGKFFRKDV